MSKICYLKVEHRTRNQHYTVFQLVDKRGRMLSAETEDAESLREIAQGKGYEIKGRV